MDSLQAYFAGTWRDGSGPRYTTLYPADGSVVAELSACTSEDVDLTIRAAAAAQPAWAAKKAHERALVLYRMAELIRQESESLARLQTLDNGKPLSETRALVASAAGTLQYFAAAIETFSETITPQRGDALTLSRYEALGVVAAITPWNSPIASEAQKIAPALAAGNAIVVKPAEITPRLAIELARIALAAGLPSGLLSVLPGKGSVVGEALVRHPLVRRVAFTGGTTVGRGIARLAAEKFMPVSLELGGKSPTIVCPDADLTQAVAGILWGIFSSSGESCIAGSRCFIHQSVYAEVKTALVKGAEHLRVGDPMAANTHLGPLVSDSHRNSVERYVALGLAEGGQLLCGGQRLHSDSGGYYYAPTIFEGLANTARLCREEVFGPVLVLIPYADDDELIAACNDNDYGLAAGIWTADYRRALALGSALHTGTVWVNTYKQFSISTPFGGMKDSGLGREKGQASLAEYMTQKSYYLGLSHAPNPWAN
ncbi:MAG: hypothetical protein RLZZ502_725 [Pseudomonadota bacterium]